MRYKPDHKANTKQRILQAAAKGFMKNGIESTGISSLMSDLKLTHGGFYAHFPDKEALVVESVMVGLNANLDILLNLLMLVLNIEIIQRWDVPYLPYRRRLAEFQSRVEINTHRNLRKYLNSLASTCPATTLSRKSTICCIYLHRWQVQWLYLGRSLTKL
jgi:AcrR family transcriptional regulator